jgi:chemotaxis family two-component system response regulator PixG
MNPLENTAKTQDTQRTIISRFNYLSLGEFTGLLIVQTSDRLWKILFYRGKIVWAIDGNNPNRFWQRLLFIYNKKFKLADLPREKINSPLVNLAIDHEVWQYVSLINLLDQGKLKEKELKNIITLGIEEVLFDIFQANHLDQLAFRSIQETFNKEPLIQVNVAEILATVANGWGVWSQNSLVSVSPNQAPVINHPVKLYSQTSPIIYQKLITAINGTRTLREIAMEMNQDLLLLTRSLMPYINTGVIDLVYLPDFPDQKMVGNINKHDQKSTPSVKKNDDKTIHENHKSKRETLIVHIDDSITSCQRMEILAKKLGCRLITINDSTKALPILLENKPDLIFLDLIMPLVSGYEICSQLRRISVFSKTPIIILTAKDGIIDRIKSKAIGASAFIHKPLDIKHLKNILIEHKLIDQ